MVEDVRSSAAAGSLLWADPSKVSYALYMAAQPEAAAGGSAAAAAVTSPRGPRGKKRKATGGWCLRLSDIWCWCWCWCLLLWLLWLLWLLLVSDACILTELEDAQPPCHTLQYTHSQAPHAVAHHS